MTDSRQQGPQMIDPVEFGRLLARVEALAGEVASLTAQLKEIQGGFKIGRGVFIGLMLSAGLAIYGLKGMIDRVFGAGP